MFLRIFCSLSLIFILSCAKPPTIKKPVERQKTFNSPFERVWDETITILVKSGAVLGNLNKDLGLIVCELILSPSQLRESVLVGGGAPLYGRGSQGRCKMNILIKKVDKNHTDVFLNCKFLLEVYSSFGGKLGEAYLDSNGKIERDFFTKLAIALGEKHYKWLEKQQSP